MNQLSKLLFLVVFVAGVASSCKPDNLYGDVPETQPPVFTPHYDSINENIPGYYSGLPARYTSNINPESYPTVICFVGAGGYGNGDSELDRIVYGISGVLHSKKMPASFKVKGEVFSLVFLAPQFKVFPTNQDIKDFIEYAKARYKIDTTRLYLVGTSLGGRMASDYSAQYPQEVAALITMGGCSDDDLLVTLAEKCSNIAASGLPVWSFHNNYDEAWPVGASKRFISTISSFLPTIEPRMTIFEESEGEANHDCWTRAVKPEYKESGLNIYEWMLQYKR